MVTVFGNKSIDDAAIDGIASLYFQIANKKGKQEFKALVKDLSGPTKIRAELIEKGVDGVSEYIEQRIANFAKSEKDESK